MLVFRLEIAPTTTPVPAALGAVNSAAPEVSVVTVAVAGTARASPASPTTAARAGRIRGAYYWPAPAYSCLVPLLTFDDGPDPVFTPRVLDLLAERGARATFFCVGAAATEHPDLIRRIAADGHVLGSHSYTHPRAARTLPWRLIADWRAGRAAVESAAGRPVVPFRPPYGSIGVSGRIALRALGLAPTLWSVDLLDWAPAPSAEAIAAGLLAARADDLVLLHDGVFDPVEPSCRDRSATVEGLCLALAAGLVVTPPAP